MAFFDKTDSSGLGRRETRKWVLAISMTTLLSIGGATVMFPTVFSRPINLDGDTARNCLLVLCAVSILLVSCFADRQIVISYLRRRLSEEENRAITAQNHLSVHLMKCLPGMDAFRERLAKEIRRSESPAQPISMLVVVVEAKPGFADAKEAEAACADAANALRVKMRRGDSLYVLRPGIFGIVLPVCSTATAVLVSDRFFKSLMEARHAGKRFSFEMHVLNHPAHFQTIQEMLQGVRSRFLEKLNGVPALEESENVEYACVA